ncbi:hypothetical protein Gotur_026775 [Gossypium turneri]
MTELSQHRNEALTHSRSNNQCTDIDEHPHDCTGNLYEVLEEDHEMPEHSNKLPYDLYEMPSCETTKTVNFEDMSDVHNLVHENPCIIDNYYKIHVETNSDPIDIATDLTVKVKVKDELYTNMELKSIVNESVEELMHFLVTVEKVLAKEIDEFDLFSSGKGNKAQSRCRNTEPPCRNTENKFKKLSKSARCRSTKYVEHNWKQIKDWNQMRKVKMDIPNLLKRKVRLTPQKEISDYASNSKNVDAVFALELHQL